MSDLADRLRSIRDKLRACAARPKFAPPGPPVPPSEVEAFESKHRVTLPEEYRAFLLEFGAGGSDPGDHGILPLAKAFDGMMDPYPEALAEPSVLDSERKFADYEEREPARGTVTLVYEAFYETYFLLVVSGTRRGQVCRFDASTRQVEWAESASGQPVGFLAWYEDTLDRLLAGAESVRVPSTMLGDEDGLTRLALDEGAPERLRRKAIGALSVLRTARHARETFVSLLERGTSSPAIEASALRSLTQVAPDDGAVDAFARRAAEAPDAALHEAAYDVAIATRRLDDVLLRFLDDPDAKLVARAFMALARRGKITPEILGRLASHASTEVRLHVLVALEELGTPEAIARVLAFLRDPGAELRRRAAQVARNRGLRQAVPALEAAIAVEKDAKAANAMARALEALR
jgi:hypothetical protein